MPHTGLLVKNERLSIELVHLLLNSNVNEVILQQGLKQPEKPRLKDWAVWAGLILVDGGGI